MCNNKDEFDKLVAKRRKANALKKKLEEQVKELDHEIIEYVTKKGEVGGKGGNSIIVFGDGYKVSVITIEQHPWDGDKLKALLGDRVDQYQTISVFPRVDIR